MKRALALDRKLMLLVAIPLVGALVFAGIGLIRLTQESNRLQRMDSFVAFTADLANLKQAYLVEQRTAWDLGRDGGLYSVYQTAINTTGEAAARLKKHLAAATSEALYSPEVKQAAATLLAPNENIAATRNFYSAQAGKNPPFDQTARTMRDHYRETSAQIMELITLLNHETDSAALRARLDGLIWYGRLASAAEDERMLHDRGFTEKQLTVAAYIELLNARSQRRYCQANALLMAPTELLEYWTNLLAKPAYERTDAVTMLASNMSAAETHPFLQEFWTEWRNVSHERILLLDTVEPYLLHELSGFLQARQQATQQQLWKMGILLGVLMLVSLGVAAAFITRIKRQIRTALSQLETGIGAIIEAVGAAREAARNLAEGAANEAAGLEQTGAALITLTSVNQQTVTIAEQTVDHMKQTGIQVGSSIQTMQSLTGNLEKISDSSNATFRIVKTINEIAFQTNILALNAAIEAASAGAAGTGFAVVADEVRNLAKRSADAAAETGRLVDEARQANKRGLHLGQEVNHALSAVDANAGKSGNLMLSIHAASQQMLMNMQHMNTSSRAMESVTQKNAAIADDNATAADAIVQETQKLQSTIQNLEQIMLGVRPTAA